MAKDTLELLTISSPGFLAWYTALKPKIVTNAFTTEIFLSVLYRPAIVDIVVVYKYIGTFLVILVALW